MKLSFDLALFFTTFLYCTLYRWDLCICTTREKSTTKLLTLVQTWLFNSRKWMTGICISMSFNKSLLFEDYLIQMYYSTLRYCLVLRDIHLFLRHCHIESPPRIDISEIIINIECFVEVWECSIKIFGFHCVKNAAVHIYLTLNTN